VFQFLFYRGLASFDPSSSQRCFCASLMALWTRDFSSLFFSYRSCFLTPWLIKPSVFLGAIIVSDARVASRAWLMLMVAFFFRLCW
jgi:hypothetical protein